MKKILFIMLAGLLVLAACDSNGDEPTPAKVDDVDIYLAVNGWEYHSVIYSAEGDTIFVADEGWDINQLTADGSDWYAGLEDENHVYHVIKNGQELFSTDETVFGLCVDGGNVYTLRVREVDWRVEYEWVYKNQERIYQISTDEYFSTQILVKDGHITLAPYYSPTPRYWQDGQFVDIPGVEGGLEYCCMDKVGDDVLIGFNGMNGLRGYWRNGNYYNDIPDRMSINGVKLVDGKVILAGSVVVSQGVGGVKTAPALVIDGKEYRPDGTVGRMRVYGKDFYYLSINKLNQILKNMKPVPLGYIEVKDERYQEVFGDRINLSQIPTVSDFIVLPKKK